MCEHREAQQPDWAQTEFCEELKEQQKSDTIHLLTYKQPEETRIAKLKHHVLEITIQRSTWIIFKVAL